MTMTDFRKNPLETVKALLRLAENAGTEEEAANAAQKAAAVALKYGIDTTKLQLDAGQKDTRNISRVAVFEGVGYELWVMNIISGVSTMFGAKAFYTNGYNKTIYSVLCREGLGEAIRLTVDYLVTTTTRMNRKAVAGRGLDKTGRHEFRQSFRLQCSRVLYKRMIDRTREMSTQDDVAQASTGSTALVVANHYQQEMKAIEAWMEENGFEVKTSKATGPSIRSNEGAAAGAAAGRSIGLDQQVGRSNNDRLTR